MVLREGCWFCFFCLFVFFFVIVCLCLEILSFEFGLFLSVSEILVLRITNKQNKKQSKTKNKMKKSLKGKREFLLFCFLFWVCSFLWVSFVIFFLPFYFLFCFVASLFGVTAKWKHAQQSPLPIHNVSKETSSNTTTIVVVWWWKKLYYY